MSDLEQGYQGVERGDLVFHALDGFAGAVGVSDSAGKCTPVYHVCEAVSDDDLRFVAHALRVLGLAGYLAVQAGNVRQRSVDFRNWEQFARIEIPRPPAKTQAEIADYLATRTAAIDRLIGLRRQMLTLVEERRVAAVDHAVTSADAPLVPIARLAHYFNGWPFKPGDFTPSGLPVIRIRQLVDSEAECDHFDGQLPDRVQLRDGDLVFSWSGSLQVRRWRRGEAYLNQHLFRVVPTEGVDTDWLEFALDAATRLFDAHLHGSAMTHITLPMMKAVAVPLPDMPHQRQLAQALIAATQWCDDLRARLIRQIECLIEHRSAIVAAAITGGLDLAREAS